MIKVFKKLTSPESLTAQKKYDSEEVKQQLIADHQGKCYLCERTVTTDFQVEHLIAKNIFLRKNTFGIISFYPVVIVMARKVISLMIY